MFKLPEDRNLSPEDLIQLGIEASAEGWHEMMDWEAYYAMEGHDLQPIDEDIEGYLKGTFDIELED